jgi:hypothetical protein
MWRGEELKLATNAQVAIHTLLAGVTNSYRADYGMTELRMDSFGRGNKFLQGGMGSA